MNTRRHLVLVFALGVVGSFVVMACSSDDSPGAAINLDGGGANSPDGGGSNPSDGGNPIDSGSSGNTGTATSSVVITQFKANDGTYSGGITPEINPHYPNGQTCKNTTTGPCQVIDCSGLTDTDDGPVTDNAGTITVTGGMLSGAQTLTYSTADSDYSANQLTQQIFSAGQTFNVAAAGGPDHAAFSGTSAGGPGEITITSPASVKVVLDQPVYHIDLTKDFTFAWSGGTAGSQVFVAVSNLDTNLNFICSFDAAAGTGTIPAAVVAQFESADSTVPLPFGVSVEATTNIASDVRVTVQSNVAGSGLYSTE